MIRIYKPRVFLWYFCKIDQVLDILLLDHNRQFQRKQTNSLLLFGSYCNITYVFKTFEYLPSYEQGRNQILY